MVSAGRANHFGHPVPEVLERYRAAGAEVFRTDQDGAVTVDTDGHSVAVHTFTGRSFNLPRSHEDTKYNGGRMLRILPSPFAQSWKRWFTDIIGCGIAVHRALGPGLRRDHLPAGCRLELAASAVAVRAREANSGPLSRRDCSATSDSIWSLSTKLSSKSRVVDRLSPVHHAQLLSCLRASVCEWVC